MRGETTGTRQTASEPPHPTVGLCHFPQPRPRATRLFPMTQLIWPPGAAADYPSAWDSKALSLGCEKPETEPPPRSALPCVGSYLPGGFVEGPVRGLGAEACERAVGVHVVGGRVVRIETAARPVQVEGGYLVSPGLFVCPIADADAARAVQVCTDDSGHRCSDGLLAVAAMLVDAAAELLGVRVAGHIGEGEFEEFPCDALLLGCGVSGHRGPFD